MERGEPLRRGREGATCRGVGAVPDPVEDQYGPSHFLHGGDDPHVQVVKAPERVEDIVHGRGAEFDEGFAQPLEFGATILEVGLGLFGSMCTLALGIARCCSLLETPIGHSARGQWSCGVCA